MKLSIYLISASLFACTIISCKKEKADKGQLPYEPAGTHVSKNLRNISLDEVQSSLEGKWYLLRADGGFTGSYSKEYSGVYHIFGKNVLIVNDNGKVTETPVKWNKIIGIFSSTDSVWGLQGTMGHDITSPIFLNIESDTLYTSDNAYDGLGHTYIKIK